MNGFADSIPSSARRHRGVLTAAVGFGLLVGFVAQRQGDPSVAPAMAIYVGCFVTLTLVARMVSLSFEEISGSEQAGPALRRLYLWQVGQITLLAGMARALMTLGLLPFLWDAPVGAAMQPIVMGWPLDVLLVTMAVSLAAALGNGGTALAFTLAVVFGALGQQAVVEPDAFGSLNGLLRVTAFPWMALRGLADALGSGNTGALLTGVLRVLAYGAGWVALGLAALAWRARRARRQETVQPS